MAKLLKKTRGDTAKELKIHAETLRYYEQIKLINKPTRLENNYRVYGDDDITRIKFILMAKQLGFSLKEIKELLNLSLDEKTNRPKVRSLTQKISNKLDIKIKQLSRMKKILDKLILLCQSNKISTCPILKSLNK